MTMIALVVMTKIKDWKREKKSTPLAVGDKKD